MSNLDIQPTISHSLYNDLKIDMIAVPWEHLNTYTAIAYFLCNESEPPDNALPLQQVQRYLQSFTHLCDAADWRRAAMVLTVELDENIDEELHDTSSGHAMRTLGTVGLLRRARKTVSGAVGQI
ncbi:MAG: hypothetical protein AAGA60_27150 [Cyanobacteria bacterium P01_E01_bin.42]